MIILQTEVPKHLIPFLAGTLQKATVEPHIGSPSKDSRLCILALFGLPVRLGECNPPQSFTSTLVRGRGPGNVVFVKNLSLARTVSRLTWGSRNVTGTYGGTYHAGLIGGGT